MPLLFPCPTEIPTRATNTGHTRPVDNPTMREHGFLLSANRPNVGQLAHGVTTEAVPQKKGNHGIHGIHGKRQKKQGRMSGWQGPVLGYSVFPSSYSLLVFCLFPCIPCIPWLPFFFS